MAAQRSFVSFLRAPGFSSLPKEALLSTPLKLIPPTSIPAFVLPEVITPSQERSVLLYSNALFRRLPFVEGHVDRLIHHYKEFYRSGRQLLADDRAMAEFDLQASESLADPATASTQFGSELKRADLSTVKSDVRDVIRQSQAIAQSFIPAIPLADRVHFLQLHTSGFIRAHVDESRNSSGCVAGLTLGTARVMTLTHPKFPGAKIDMLLAPRSIYAIAGTARTEWEHSVDWEVDDEDHTQRAASGDAEAADPPAVLSETDHTKPIIFEGAQTGFFRGTRNALIFRGCSPMDLFMHRFSSNASSAAPS